MEDKLLVKDLFKKSIYGVVGYVANIQDIDTIERYILFNKEILLNFPLILVATNYGDTSLKYEYHSRWTKYFNNVEFIDLEKNKGHNIGNLELDNVVVNYVKQSKNYNWLVKSATDILIFEEILERNISLSDFYFLPSFGYSGIKDLEFNFVDCITPQTNFYIINTSKIDNLVTNSFLDESYNKIQKIENYNGRIWEYIPGWTCERILHKCVVRNLLKYENLLTEKEVKKLYSYVISNNVNDPSHKNINTGGVCHFHFQNKPITYINE